MAPQRVWQQFTPFKRAHQKYAVVHERRISGMHGCFPESEVGQAPFWPGSGLRCSTLYPRVAETVAAAREYGRVAHRW